MISWESESRTPRVLNAKTFPCCFSRTDASCFSSVCNTGLCCQLTAVVLLLQQTALCTQGRQGPGRLLCKEGRWGGGTLVHSPRPAYSVQAEGTPVWQATHCGNSVSLPML